MQSTFRAYHELDFTSGERNTIYWHYTVPRLGEEGAECYSCSISFLIKSSLMEVVETLNPGQPAAHLLQCLRLLLLRQLLHC